MTYSRVSVLVPTRKRIERLRTMLASFEATTDGRAELIFRVDEDDRESRDFLLDHHLSLKVVIGPRFKGYRSMPAFFNEMFNVATGDVLMCGNDDMIFKTIGWPSLILRAADRFPDGLFDFGVRTHNEDHYPFYIVSRTAAEHLGFLLDPRTLWGDIYWRDIMSAFGRCVKLPAVEIVHDWIGFAPDQTFEEERQGEIHGEPDYWNVTHPQTVNEAVEKLRQLL